MSWRDFSHKSRHFGHQDACSAGFVVEEIAGNQTGFGISKERIIQRGADAPNTGCVLAAISQTTGGGPGMTGIQKHLQGDLVGIDRFEQFSQGVVGDHVTVNTHILWTDGFVLAIHLVAVGIHHIRAMA